MTSQTGNRRTSGFTLLEVLVAVAIFAVGVTAVLQGFQVSMHAMERAHQVMVSSRLAAQRLDDLRLGCRDGVAPRSGAGMCKAPFEGYHWSVEASEESVGASLGDTGAEDADVQLHALLLRVWERSEDDGVQVETHLCTVRSEAGDAL